MTLRDRLRRWWNPGKWRDEHPEVSDGEGFYDAEQRLAERTVAESGEFSTYDPGDLQ
ncbi:MAG TPA: hypothetical protein VKB43_03680 [Gaiellaceae bacterium]|nr:hypothetical protein [Gaiellaceae bacterium]